MSSVSLCLLEDKTRSYKYKEKLRSASADEHVEKAFLTVTSTALSHLDFYVCTVTRIYKLFGESSQRNMYELGFTKGYVIGTSGVRMLVIYQRSNVDVNKGIKG